MLFRKRKDPVSSYDKSEKIPTIRSSICTGEQVADFKDPVSGKFEELMLVRDGRDFQEFQRRYQVKESEIRREWGGYYETVDTVLWRFQHLRL